LGRGGGKDHGRRDGSPKRGALGLREKKGRSKKAKRRSGAGGWRVGGGVGFQEVFIL